MQEVEQNAEHEKKHQKDCACGRAHIPEHHHENGAESSLCHHDGENCGCGHDHFHGEEGDGENRNILIGRLITSALLLLIGLFFPSGGLFRFLFSLFSVLSIGYDVMYDAARKMLRRELLDESFLMTAACTGAFILGEYTEGAMILFLFQLGEFFQDLAVDRSRKSISSLMEIRSDTATVIRNGEEKTVGSEEIEVGEMILVRPGERIPLDGTVTEGESFLDTVALTGESVPRSVREGDEALSGCINLRGVLRIRVERAASDSAVSRILKLVEEANDHKSHSDRFITRFARVYTPAVVGMSILLFVIAGLVTGNWAEWLRRSLTFLVISCPCALVISVPLSYFNGIGRASRRGILVKGSNILEMMSKTAMVAMDKTGTVTEGVFDVVAVHPQEMNQEELVRYAAAAEKYSMHPIAEALKRSCPDWDSLEIGKSEETAGQGVVTQVDGHRIAVGNERLMKAEGADCRDCHLTGTIVHIAKDGRYEGHLVIADVIKDNAADAFAKLKELGVHKIVLLTGDRQGAAEDIGKRVGADEIHAELKPEDKVKEIYRLQAQRKNNSEAVAFVGDGINDAPVLAAADIGVAMGAAGADAAVEAADVVLIDDDPIKLAAGIQLARRTQRIVMENIAGSIAIKVLVMILGAMGAVPLWLAVFSDVGVCLLAILNAMR